MLPGCSMALAPLAACPLLAAWGPFQAWGAWLDLLETPWLQWLPAWLGCPVLPRPLGVGWVAPLRLEAA
jgi:hypothetical protein